MSLFAQRSARLLLLLAGACSQLETTPVGGETTTSSKAWQSIDLVSAKSDGSASSGGFTGHALSGDGRLAAFAVWAPHITDDFGSASPEQVLVKNVSTGSITLASSSAGDVMADDAQFGAVIDEVGTYVAFVSMAGNLTSSGENSQAQIYRKNLTLGSIELVSSPDFDTLGDASSTQASISGNGQHVAFYSTASNLVSGAVGDQVFIKNFASETLSLVSASITGTLGNGPSASPSISHLGDYVAFTSSARNLIASFSVAPSSPMQIYRKDTSSGEVLPVSTPDGIQVANATSGSPKISGNGRYVVFTSLASNLISGLSGSVYQVFRKDLNDGSLDLVSASQDSAPSTESAYLPQISHDGRYVAFISADEGLIAGSSFGHRQALLKDLLTGKVTLLSSPDGRTPANADVVSLQISRDGSYVSFEASATNLVPEATASAFQIYRVLLK
jgi:Tol biopolymer transport system component